MVESLRAEARRLEEEITGLVRARRGYVAQFRALVERQLHDVEAIEASAPPAPTPASAAPAKPEEPQRSAHPTPAWLDSLVKE